MIRIVATCIPRQAVQGASTSVSVLTKALYFPVKRAAMATRPKLDQVIEDIETIIHNDVGKRGIANITLPGQLTAAASSFLDAKAVVVLTGFPCRLNDTPPTETDGPPGAIALAMAALKLGKPTAIATDASSSSVIMRCCMAAGLPSMGDFALYSFPPASEWTDEDTVNLNTVIAEYDHAVAIERAGRATDGSYYTMRAFKMDHLVAPIDIMLTADCACGIGDLTPKSRAHVDRSLVEASEPVLSYELHGKLCQDRGMQTEPLSELPDLHFSAAGAEIAPESSAASRMRSASFYTGPRVSRAESMSTMFACTRTSTGIGDGGNECGMGKVLDSVRAHIPRGDVIACATPADNLITAGVSNWGGWGLCAAVEALLRSRLGDTAKAVEFAASPARVRKRPSQGGIDFTLRYLADSEKPGFLLPTAVQEEAVANAMIAAGARDGISGALDGSVDGMPLDTHLRVLESLRNIVITAFK